jgi:hypothetical protein
LQALLLDLVLGLVLDSICQRTGDFLNSVNQIFLESMCLG